MSLTNIENHAELAVARLPEAHKGMVDTEGLVTALGGRAQTAEDALWTLFTDRNLDTGVGVQLDCIGQIIDCPRGGLDDDDYRVRLRARVQANRSTGTPESILTIARLFLRPDNAIELREYQPACFDLILHDAITADIDVILTEVGIAKPAGVRGWVTYSLYDDDETFQFASGDSPEADAATGFDGGYFADTEEV